MSKRLGKIYQLDSVRCFAALIVILHHYLPRVDIMFPLGAYGVDIFFIISGFLVTAILLEQKEVVTNKFLLIRNFIFKRALRIFPIYYLVLFFWTLVAVVLHAYIWGKGEAIYYYTYTSNILFFIKGMKSALGHTWTLAVEEQFYIVWPLLIIFIKPKKEYILIASLVLFSLIFKSFSGLENVRYLTISNLDTLGIGALLATAVKYKKYDLLLFMNKYKKIILLVSMCGLIVDAYFSVFGLIFNILLLIFGTTLVIGTYFGFTGTIGKILDNKKLQYLGKISYGLYLYHAFMPFLIHLVELKVNKQFNGLVIVGASCILTFGVSYLSYNYIEKGFIRIKDRFDL